MKQRPLETERRIRVTILITGILLYLPCIACAFERIPNKTGFSGFINFGVGLSSVESNLIAGNDFGNISDDKIDSIQDSPDSETSALPVANFELAYTFSETRTQVYAGNLLEDFIRYDLATLLGVRQELQDKSVIALSYVFSAIPTEVWEDPYVENLKRKETDRTSAGGRVTWSRILGSNLQLKYTTRDIEIDDERSGKTFLGLNDAEAALLDREGDTRQIEALYAFDLTENQKLVPALIISDFDLDGDAMNHDRYSLQFTHTYHKDRFTLLTNAFYGSSDYDEINPIYNKERDDDRYGLSFTTFHRQIFGLKDWTGVVNFAAYIENSNIDFYDTQIIMLSLSGLYKF